MITLPCEIESLDGFQNLDSDKSWLDHDPVYEPDWEELEWERRVEENERLSMAAWWEDEGVRCWTWVCIIPGYDPNRNPYEN